MATITHRVTTPDTGNTPNTSGGFTPALNDLLVVFVTKESSVAMVSADLSSSTGLTFTLIRTELFRSSVDIFGVFVSDALVSDTTAGQTVAIASGTDAGGGSIISVYSVSGMALTGASAVRGQGGQSNKASGAPAPAASAFAQAALTGNPVLAALANATNPAGMTPPASPFAEDQDTGYTTGAVTGLETAFCNSGFTGTTVTWGGNSASISAAIAVELSTATVVVRGAAIADVAAITAKGGKVTATDTATAKVSLASGSTPTARTGHELHFRARMQSGTGVVTLRAALYEGASNRSGDLESGALTTSLAEYTLPITEANATNIGSYSNLDVWFWGHSTNGQTVVVEVAEAWLVMPASAGAQTVVAGAAVSAVAQIASTPQRTEMRQAGISATAAIASTPQRVELRQTVFAASATITSTPQRARLRQTGLAAQAVVTTSGLKVTGAQTVVASVAVTAAPRVTVGQQLALLRQSAIAAHPVIAAAFLRALLRQAGVAAHPAIGSTPQRIVFRQTATAATASVVSGGITVSQVVTRRTRAVRPGAVQRASRW